MSVQTNSNPKLLNEPAVAYGRVNYFSMAERDISKNYIKRILNVSKLSLAELMNIIPISIDTYKRKTASNPSIKEKILEIEEVYRTGLDAFGEGFLVWMATENVVLDDIVPKKLLSNSFGVRQLLDKISRMEHRVLA